MNGFEKNGHLLTVMLQCKDPETALRRIRLANEAGAEAYGLQTESLLREYQTPEVYRRLFAAMEGRPAYVTSYRSCENKGRSDEELAEELCLLADCGAALCDVMGDLYCQHPEELTDDAQAIEKQIELIYRLHCKGAGVLMSSHVHRYRTKEQVMSIASEQQRRGADVAKIVTRADTMREQLDTMETMLALKEKLDIPFLLLCGGECTILRRLAWKMGNCTTLCVYEHDEFSTKVQPLLTDMLAIKNELGF